MRLLQFFWFFFKFCKNISELLQSCFYLSSPILLWNWETGVVQGIQECILVKVEVPFPVWLFSFLIARPVCWLLRSYSLFEFPWAFKGFCSSFALLLPNDEVSVMCLEYHVFDPMEIIVPYPKPDKALDTTFLSVLTSSGWVEHDILHWEKQM